MKMKKKPTQMIAVLGMAAVLASGMSVTSFAQPYDVMDFSDTYVTDGVQRTFYFPDYDWTGEVCEFTNKNFTITVNYPAETEMGWKNTFTGVWMAEVVEDNYARPFTDNPWEVTGIEVHALADNVFDLSGLDIQEGKIYAIVAECVAYPPQEKSTTNRGGMSANAGGGISMASYTAFFKINSQGAVNAGATAGGTQTTTTGTTADDTQTTNAGAENYAGGSNDSGNSGSRGEKDVYYYWAHNDIGWWVQGSDGSYLVNRWHTSPQSGLYYYLGADGYMLTDTITPDGYYVNADGAWVPEIPRQVN